MNAMRIVSTLAVLALAACGSNPGEGPATPNVAVIRFDDAEMSLTFTPVSTPP